MSIAQAPSHPQSIHPTTDTVVNIPRELLDRPQWVLWRLENRDGRPTKIPYQISGVRASSTDQTTWNTAEAVWDVYQDGGYSGIGFVFSTDDPYCGIDLDDSVDEEGNLMPWAMPIVARLNSYTEISPSGTGVKIWIKARLPERVKHKVKYDSGEIEVYDQGRYFTVTAAHLAGTPATIADGQEALDWLIGLAFAQPKAERPAGCNTGSDDVQTAIEAIEHLGTSRADDYNTWLAVGMAAYTVSSGSGMLSAWTRFSEKSAKYQEGETERKWRGFKSGPSQIGELITWAKQDSGWRPSNTHHHVDRVDHAGVDEPWPDPLPLPNGLPPVQLFDYDLLPDSLHNWIKDIADRMQAPPDYCATTAMVVAGSLIGRKVGMRPKAHDDWTVVCNLYGVNIGRPALLKSPAMQEILKYLQRKEAEAKKEYDEAMQRHEVEQLVAEATKKVRKEELKAKIKNGEDAGDLADQLAGGACAEPVRKRSLMNDTTVEKLGVTLADNPNGVLIFLDELITFLRTMDRDGHEGDRGFYLTAWNGDSRFTYDRIGRGTVDIEAAIVSIIGAIQPGVLGDYLHGAVNGGAGDDGLMQRFQMTVWPDVPSTWHNVDRYPNSAARDAAYAALDRLATLDPDGVKAMHDAYDRDAMQFLRFDAEAQEVFDAWRADLESRIRRPGEHACIEAHLAKYRKLIPAVALILHLLDGGIGPIPTTVIQKAVRWGEYLESHARRVYASITEAPAVASRHLAGRIESGIVSDLFTARDIYRMGWTGLDRQQTDAAIDVLISLNWVEERIEPTGGRSKTRYAINPKITKSSASELTKLPKDPSGGSVSCKSSENAISEVR